MGNVLPVHIDRTQEALQVFDRFGLGKTAHGVDVGLLRGHRSVRYSVAQVVDGSAGKLAFFKFELNIFSAEGGQESVQAAEVFFESSGVDNNVVEVVHNVLKVVALNYRFHSSLKGCRGVFQPEWHNKPLVMAAVCNKCCLGNVIGMHWYVPITRGDVESTEVSGRSECVQDIIDAGNRFIVWDRDCIESPVVDAHPRSAFTLFSARMTGDA